MTDALRVLVAEDDFILATELQYQLARLNAEVVGPFSEAHDAVDHLENVDAAILDIRLRDDTSFPLADCLLTRETPFVFYTAYTLKLPERYHGVPVISKPTPTEALVELLRSHGARRKPPAINAVAALPLMILHARDLMPDSSSADRLVELTLKSVIAVGTTTWSSQADFEQYMISQMRDLHVQRGKRLLS
ncbi:response regulator [Silicimonas algicola]|uniref:Response regulator receiver protein n=1 Tax=Silicimonas algicola TaxID=1826607 RepID=A0A316FWL8_9RHOB|nr:response regulator [Silicimonas algicola]AZQ67576.1 response regulator [Silicimonas algicola]PWK52732.1 response regulator receiver protein [Silicimonas algicola]